MRAKVQIVTLDASGSFFANFVLSRGKKLFIGLPVIRVITADPTAFQFLQQTLASGIRAAVVDKGDNLPVLPVESVPSPALPLLGADERPEFIDLQVAHATRSFRLTHFGGGLAQSLEHCVGAQEKNAGNVPDA